MLPHRNQCENIDAFRMDMDQGSFFLTRHQPALAAAARLAKRIVQLGPYNLMQIKLFLQFSFRCFQEPGAKRRRKTRGLVLAASVNRQ